jgi:hypothetical protein
MKMTRIPYLRAVSTDKRLTPPAIKAVLAKTSLSRLTRQVCDAFAEAGLLSDREMNAAAVVDGDRRYSVNAVDGALAAFPPIVRMEIKNTLARCSLL